MAAFDLVIFGGLGDLSRKKLLPALYSGFTCQQPYFFDIPNAVLTNSAGIPAGYF